MALDYFTLTELRALPDVSNTTKYSDAQLTAAGEWVQGIIERECQTSFVARSTTETLNGDDQEVDGGLKLSTPWILNVTAVTSNGVAFTAPQLAEVKVKSGVAFRRAAGDFTGFISWDLGARNIVITYDGGYSAAPPSDLKSAALQAARYRAIKAVSGAGISDRAITITNEMGNIQLSTPGKNHPTGLPEVDEVIIGWRDKLALFGFS
ncbi:MAG: hypothetical protein ACRD1X_04090 [Vicinamibacteria bacterium]